MVSLSSFRIDSKEVEEGTWVEPGDEYGDLTIKTRGLTDRYYDSRASKLRRAAMQYGGDQNKIPTAKSRKVLAECLIEHVLLDVKNISDDAGAPVTFDRFCELLHNPDYGDLLIACIRAASQVGLAKRDEMDEAAKNSQPRSSKS